MVRALASHQCRPDSIPGVNAICGCWGFCWFLPSLREVFLRVLRFSPLLKNEHFPKIPIRPGIRWTENHLVDVLPLNRYLFIYLFIIFVCNTEFLEKKLHRGRAFPNELKCGAYSGAALIQIKTVQYFRLYKSAGSISNFFFQKIKKSLMANKCTRG